MCMYRYWPSGGGARHHPGSGWHMLRGEAFAWTHGNILLDAIYMIEKDMEKGLSHKHMLGGASIYLSVSLVFVHIR